MLSHEQLQDVSQQNVREEEPLLPSTSSHSPTNPTQLISRQPSPERQARQISPSSSASVNVGDRSIVINETVNQSTNDRTACISNYGSPLYKKIVSVLYDMGIGYLATVGIAQLIEKNLIENYSSSMFFSGMPYILSRLVNEAYLILMSQPHVQLQEFVSLYPRLGGCISAILISYATREIPQLSSPLITSGIGFFAGKVAENVCEYIFTKGCCETNSLRPS